MIRFHDGTKVCTGEIIRSTTKWVWVRADSGEVVKFYRSDGREPGSGWLNCLRKITPEDLPTVQ